MTRMLEFCKEITNQQEYLVKQTKSFGEQTILIGWSVHIPPFEGQLSI